jgi:hypothetical protein
MNSELNDVASWCTCTVPFGQMPPTQTPHPHLGGGVHGRGLHERFSSWFLSFEILVVVLVEKRKKIKI